MLLWPFFALLEVHDEDQTVEDMASNFILSIL
jgi:hypothetical protein